MSGTVAVSGETGVGGGGSGCLSRLDSDRCGHFRGLFLDSCVYVWESETKRECVCVRALANALYSDCSPQSKSIYSQANSHGRESKQTHCLIRFGSRCVFAQGRLILWVFPSLWSSPAKLMRRFRRSLGEWFSGNRMGTWRLCKRTCTEGGSQQMLRLC